MELIEHLEKRWKSLRRSVNVPEFTNGAGDFYVYYTPVTAREQQEIKFSEIKDPVEQVWSVILHKARDETGSPIFKEDQKERLFACLEFSKMVDLANRLADFPTVEDAEKN